MYKLFKKLKKWFHIRQRIKQEAAYDEFIRMIEMKSIRRQCMLGEDMDKIKSDFDEFIKRTCELYDIVDVESILRQEAPKFLERARERGVWEKL